MMTPEDGATKGVDLEVEGCHVAAEEIVEMPSTGKSVELAHRHRQQVRDASQQVRDASQ